jgi:membrane-bound hydrogenase subunit alpha
MVAPPRPGKDSAITSAYLAQIGPNHPALKEPVMFTFELDGEQVKKTDFAPGMAHRGIEWAGTRRNAIQTLYLAERICGICGITHSVSYARAIEQIAEIEVPPRAHYIRSIVGELERIHSHLLWAGVAAHELGFDSLFFLTWNVREKVMDTLEYICGNRVHYGIMQIGGANRDITSDMFPTIREALDHFDKHFERLAKLFLEDTTIRIRCRDCGVLTKEEAMRLCAVGPTARASGVAKDVRQDHPYAAYADVPVKAITPDQWTGEVRGDVYDRIVVRLLEVKQSVELTRAFLDNMPPDGPVLAEEKMPKLLAKIRKAKGDAIGRHEAPRGEVLHYVRLNGTVNPEAWKVRAPSYNNYMPWIPMLEEEQIADIPVIVASIDPCISCCDRVAFVRNGRSDIVTKEDLHKLSVEKTRRIQGRA